MGMFTASRWQVATYLLGVCPFSIAFLVFLNSSVSFIITDLIGKSEGVGDAVGNLGFADELVALVACPLWGLLSDRIGVRTVCCVGYVIIGVALFVFVQAKSVYPELLLGRLLFSIGGAAASTMVTAVLPTMSFVAEKTMDAYHTPQQNDGPTLAPAIASDFTITPMNYRAETARGRESHAPPNESDRTSRIAGLVGMATGCGALIALSVFLPLPARFQKAGLDPGVSLQYSYYIVGALSISLAGVCTVGLRGLHSEERKGWRSLLGEQGLHSGSSSSSQTLTSTAGLLMKAFKVGLTRSDIFIGYVGGFVARASSVGISLFVPLLVNAAFLSSGLCDSVTVYDTPGGFPEIKRRCPRAYVVAAELTGVSQLVALLLAPLFGYWSSKLSNKSVPLVFAAASGIIGYPLFAAYFDAHDENTASRAVAFVAVCLIGISQIGAIVCSLAILSGGILRQEREDLGKIYVNVQNETDVDYVADEGAPLIPSSESDRPRSGLAELKGSIAGIYSFYGGAGILILTKAGGALFDSTTIAAPFYLMASFNAILMVAAIAVRLRKPSGCT